MKKTYIALMLCALLLLPGCGGVAADKTTPVEAEPNEIFSSADVGKVEAGGIEYAFSNLAVTDSEKASGRYTVSVDIAISGIDCEMVEQFSFAELIKTGSKDAAVSSGDVVWIDNEGTTQTISFVCDDWPESVQITAPRFLLMYENETTVENIDGERIIEYTDEEFDVVSLRYQYTAEDYDYIPRASKVVLDDGRSLDVISVRTEFDFDGNFKGGTIIFAKPADYAGTETFDLILEGITAVTEAAVIEVKTK